MAFLLHHRRRHLHPAQDTAAPEVTPDPFTAEERDILLDYFRDRAPRAFPIVFAQLWTGLRTAEAIGLQWGDVDLRTGRLSVRRSRTLGEDNPPKTAGSERTITLRPEVVAVLRDLEPLRVPPDAFVFTTPTGLPLDLDRWVETHWHRALRATGVRPRRFYATRHTFISLALGRGVNIKWLAEYCGTSVEMIEKHYARYMGDDTPAQLALLGGGPAVGGVAAKIRSRSARSGNLPGTFPQAPRQVVRMVSEVAAEGGDSNPEARKSAHENTRTNPRAYRTWFSFLRKGRIPKEPGRTRI